MKMNWKYGFCLLLLVAPFGSSFAQQKVVITPVDKFKPPVVNTFLGKYQDGAKLSVSEASGLLGLPLKITGIKNRPYSVISYQFLYKQKGYVLDPETGNRQVSYTLASARFDSTPLPKVWIDNIAGRLQSGEELYFFDVLVKDQQGRKFYAPELKITIQ